MKHSLFHILFFLLATITVGEATEIKWTPGKKDPSDLAANAPRSAIYWEKHNIPRPDYAKTDAEIARERGESSFFSVPPMLLLFFGMVGAGAFVAYVLQRQGMSMTSGSRLGDSSNDGFTSSSFLDNRRQNDDAARLARLARFGENGKQD